MSHTEAYEFIQLCHRRTFRAGEYIYHQNDPGNGLYILESGKVELIIEDTEKNDPEPAFVLEPPKNFGNLSLMYEMRRMSSARAVEEAIVLGFYRSDLDILQKRNPKIAIKFMDEVNRMLARQFDITLKALMAATSEQEAYRLQFENYYMAEEGMDDILE